MIFTLLPSFVVAASTLSISPHLQSIRSDRNQHPSISTNFSNYHVRRSNLEIVVIARQPIHPKICKHPRPGKPPLALHPNRSSWKPPTLTLSTSARNVMRIEVRGPFGARYASVGTTGFGQSDRGLPIVSLQQTSPDPSTSHRHDQAKPLVNRFALVPPPAL